MGFVYRKNVDTNCLTENKKWQIKNKKISHRDGMDGFRQALPAAAWVTETHAAGGAQATGSPRTSHPSGSCCSLSTWDVRHRSIITVINHTRCSLPPYCLMLWKWQNRSARPIEFGDAAMGAGKASEMGFDMTVPISLRRLPDQRRCQIVRPRARLRCSNYRCRFYCCSAIMMGQELASAWEIAF